MEVLFFFAVDELSESKTDVYVYVEAWRVIKFGPFVRQLGIYSCLGSRFGLNIGLKVLILLFIYFIIIYLGLNWMNIVKITIVRGDYCKCGFLFYFLNIKI